MFRASIAAALVLLICSPGNAADPAELIRRNAEDYVAAFNAGDAARAASYWTEQAEYEGPDETVLRGRKAIEQSYRELFETLPKARLAVDVQSVRLTSPSVAAETGSALLYDGDEVVRELRYKATHVRVGDDWKIDRLEEDDFESASSGYENLKPLEFLVGAWEAPGLDLVCIWSKNRHNLLRKFRIEQEGTLLLEGTQIIVWDPRREQIRSWLFDSDGGIGEGLWRRDGDRWMIEQTQTLGDGTLASAVNVIEPLGKDSFVWQSVEREANGNLLPDVPPMQITRVGVEANESDADDE